MWEGIIKNICLKWFNNLNIISSDNINIFNILLPVFYLKSPKKSFIGPHNINIISLIIGSVLGDSHLEKRKNGIGTRIIFEQSSKNVEYLMWFHNFLAERGYCNYNIPFLHKRVKKGGKIFYFYRIKSYTFGSFNWIHDMFYKWDDNLNRYIKIIPNDLSFYLTPLALAIWFMDNGSKLNPGLRIATNYFTLKDIEFLCFILKSKYDIIATPKKAGKDKGYNLYIHKVSKETFINLVKPYMVKSLYYK